MVGVSDAAAGFIAAWLTCTWTTSGQGAGAAADVTLRHGEACAACRVTPRATTRRADPSRRAARPGPRAFRIRLSVVPSVSNGGKELFRHSACLYGDSTACHRPPRVVSSPWMPRGDGSLARGEMAVLALLAEHPAHGWALSRELAPGSEIGEIWSGDRQRVYRALRKLNELGLVEASLAEPGEGAHRTVYRPTAAGRTALETWLLEPVASMREAQPTFHAEARVHRAVGTESHSAADSAKGSSRRRHGVALEAWPEAGRRRPGAPRAQARDRTGAADRDRRPEQRDRRANCCAEQAQEPPAAGRSAFRDSRRATSRAPRSASEAETATIILRFGDTSSRDPCRHRACRRSDRRHDRRRGAGGRGSRPALLAWVAVEQAGQ